MITPVIRTEPDPAERARTVLTHAATAVIEIDPDPHVVLDVLAVDTDGSLVLLAEADGALAARLADRPLRATVQAALVSPVPGPDRVLDAVTVRGVVGHVEDVAGALDVVLDAYADQPVDVVLRPEASALLRMTVTRLTVDGELVDAGSYARAAADPLAAGSDAMVEHMLCEHPEAVVELAHLLERDVVRGATGVAPVRVDRFGLTLRVDVPGGSRLARLDFAAVLAGPDELPGAMCRLQEEAAQVAVCPFDDGPR